MILKNTVHNKLALPGAPQLNVDSILLPRSHSKFSLIVMRKRERREKLIQTRRTSDRVELFYIPLHMTTSLIRGTTNVMYCLSLQGHACNADLDPPQAGPPEKPPSVYI